MQEGFRLLHSSYEPAYRAAPLWPANKKETDPHVMSVNMRVPADAVDALRGASGSETESLNNDKGSGSQRLTVSSRQRANSAIATKSEMADRLDRNEKRDYSRN